MTLITSRARPRKSGNITFLKRNDGSTAWDNLSYTYEQGRLNTVTDGSVSSNGVKVGTSVYQFDNAGNLTSDGNKGAGIAYNILNLPRQISVNSQTVQYHYDGTGAKQRMSNTNNTVNTKYAGIFEYNENNYLTRIGTDEGQIAVTSNGNTYTANYYLKDHLGNVRVVINGEGVILQETEYFAFGLSIATSAGAVPEGQTYSVNKYQFLTREKQPETGYIDLMARFYDPSVGRFMQVDPVTETQEHLSVYQYGWNNPILQSDPNGDCPSCLWGAIIGAGVDYGLQVAVNLAEGKGVKESLTDVDGKSILVSAGAGALSGGLSSINKLKTASKLVQIGIDAAVDAGANATNQLVTTGKIDATDLVIDVAASQIIGKKVEGKVESGAKNSPEGKVLQRDASRKQNIADNRRAIAENGGRSRLSQQAKAESAAQKYENHGTQRAVAAGAASSGVTSTIINKAKENDENQ